MPADLLRAVVLSALLLAPTAALDVGQVGDPAPDFSLPNTLGETVDFVFGQGDVFFIAFMGFS